MAKLPTYLVRQHRAFLYKRQVPADLQHVLRRKVWTQSLKRLDEREAVAQAMKLAAAQDAFIEFVRALPPEERAKADRMGWDAYRTLPERLAQAVTFSARVAALEDEEGADAPETAVMIQQARRAAKRMRAEAEEAAAKFAALDAPPPTLETLIPMWSEAAKTKVRDATKAKVLLYARRFHDVVGKVGIASIDRTHISEFRDHLQKQADAGRITHFTATKHLEAVARLLRVALNANIIAADPSKGIKIRGSQEATEDNDRKPFEAADVIAIFKAAERESSDFQLVLRLLAYHGMRSGEAAQLRIDDVAVTMGVQVLRIHGTFGSLKNKMSKREIPVHPACKSPLDAHLARLREAGETEWLFPTFKAYAAGRGAWLQRYASDFLRDKAKITDDRLTLHSFRHMFRTLAREVEMPEAVSRSLMGHTLGEGEHGKYGTAPSLAKRAEWIAKIDPLDGGA